jgi:hypothetical protein
MPESMLSRLQERIHPAIATVVVEDGNDRHFLDGLTLAAVALYLAMKYIDGVVDGLGIEDLGKRHGVWLRRTADEVLALMRTPPGNRSPGAEIDVQERAAALAQLAGNLSPQMTESARQSGTAAVASLLETRGVDRTQAVGTGRAIGDVLWNS